LEHPIEWFEKKLITRTPARYAGAGRRVYPGFVQLTAFMAMNPSRHLDQHIELWTHLAHGRRAEAEAIKAFYDEYFAVLDLTAEFYLETVARVFQQHLLPKGELTVKNRRVDQTPPPAAGRWPLRRVQRPQVVGAGLSDGQEHDHGGGLRFLRHRSCGTAAPALSPAPSSTGLGCGVVP
jgi:hypothetical protein